jgi:hypothetical protein
MYPGKKNATDAVETPPPPQHIDPSKNPVTEKQPAKKPAKKGMKKAVKKKTTARKK